MWRKGKVGRIHQLRLFPCHSWQRQMTHTRAEYQNLSKTGPFSLGSKWISQLYISWVAGKFVVVATLPLREVCLHKLSASVPTPSYLRRRGQASPFLIYNSLWARGRDHGLTPLQAVCWSYIHKCLRSSRLAASFSRSWVCLGWLVQSPEHTTLELWKNTGTMCLRGRTLLLGRVSPKTSEWTWGPHRLPSLTSFQLCIRDVVFTRWLWWRWTDWGGKAGFASVWGSLTEVDL